MFSVRGGLLFLSTFLVSHAGAQSCTGLGGTGAVVQDSDDTPYELGCHEDLYHIGDLGGIPAWSMEECIEACGWDDQCQAVSYGNGMCWLKSLPTDPTVRPTKSNTMDTAWVQGSFDRTCAQMGGTGATMQDNAGNTYQLGCKQDLPYIGDLGGVETSSFSSCVDACNKNSQCRAVSYGSGWCWLKTVDLNVKPSASNDMDMAWRQGSYPSKGQASPTSSRTSLTPSSVSSASSKTSPASSSASSASSKTSPTSSSTSPTVTPSGCSTYTTTDGSQYQICQNMDWQGPSVYVLNNYNSAGACAEACSLTPLCKTAVWDTISNVCHMKGSPLTSASNTRFNQINLIKQGTPLISPNSVGGKWSGVIDLPVVGGAAYVVPAQPQSNTVMLFSANSEKSFGSRTGLTKFANYNYLTGAKSELSVENTQHDMFCPGISSLSDGRVVVTGGSDANKVSIYDPSANSFSAASGMQIARGYQASTVLSNGKIFTIGGSWNGGNFNKNGETFDPVANAWTLLSGADASKILTQDPSTYRRDNHAWLHAWTDGSVFHAGPSKQMNWYTTSGSGSVASAGSRNATNDAMCAGNVMYDTGKILAAGGTLIYDDSPGVSTSYLLTLGKVGQTPSVEKIADMKYSRAFSSVVVLPDGTSVVLGGQKRSRQFTDIESTTYPELFNPNTKTWTVMNPQQIPRNYHSSAVLLGDGTVFSSGGGLCYVTDGNDNDIACDPSADHANAEIWSPPYLFNKDGSLATRPTITGMTTSNDGSGNWVRAGGSMNIRTSGGSMTFSFIRLGSSTHSVNTDQRRLSLTTTQANGAWSIKMPSDSGVLLPGYWFLFAMNSQGTPSIGRVIQVRL